MTFVYEGVVIHVCGRESFPGKVRDPITEFIMTYQERVYILQYRVWYIDNLVLHPSQILGRSGGFIP